MLFARSQLVSASRERRKLSPVARMRAMTLHGTPVCRDSREPFQNILVKMLSVKWRRVGKVWLGLDLKGRG